MSDLISRSEVLKIIDENSYVNCKDQKDFSTNCQMDKIRQNVVEIPNAFDLDKVINELEKLSIEELGVSESQFEMDKGEYSSYCTLCLYDVEKLLKNISLTS